MKRDTWIKISLIVTMGIALGYYGVYLYGQAVVDFNRQAKAAFEKALERELANRDVKKSSLNIISRVDASTIGKVPEIVWINKGSGPVEYKISTERHQQNVTEDAEARLIHSIALEEKPITPNTLNAVWQQTMKESHLTNRTALRITTADIETNSTSLSTLGYTRFASLPPLFVCTLGYRCEVEIVGTVDGSWWSVLIRYAGASLLTFFAICVLVYLFVGYLMRKLHGFPVIIEIIKTQLVKELPESGERIYQIRGGFVLYAAQKLLIADGKEITFKLQPCALFELLLNADDYELSDAAIMAQLWPDGSGTGDRLSQAVSRLRGTLKAQSSIIISRTSSGSYKLVISMVSEQN